MPRVIFHLDLDAFFVAVERCLDPALQGKPVVVSAGCARSVVAAASYEARRFGVRSAMPFVVARRLCPQAVVLPGNFHEYQKASHAFFRILESYSPKLEPVSLDEGYLDYTGCEPLFGPPLAAATAIQKRVRVELGLDVSIGISTSKIVSKIASDLAKPAGLLQVMPGREAALLSPLPIGRLMGIGPKSEERLRAQGIRTIGDLARMPPVWMENILGDSGAVWQRLALGQDDSPVHASDQAKSVGQEVTLSADTSDAKFLRKLLQRLTCEVGYRLRADGLRAGTACVKVRYDDFSLHTCSRVLSEPTNLDRLLFGTGVSLLDEILGRNREIRLIGFTGQQLTADGGQLNLLELAEQNGWERLQAASDQMRERYGSGSILWASLLKKQNKPPCQPPSGDGQ